MARIASFFLLSLFFSSVACAQEWNELHNALCQAIAGCNLAHVTHLVTQCGVDLNVRNDEGKSPLFLALLVGYPGIISFLIDQGADLKEVNAQTGSSALHLIAQGFNIKTLKLLMEKVDPATLCWLVNKKNYASLTPLHYAVSCGNLPTVDLLMGLGADIYAKDGGGNIPLHYAAYKGNFEVVKKLLITKKKISWHELDGSDGLEKVIQIGGGDYVNHRNIHGYTPLHYAIISGSLSVVHEIFENGACLSVFNGSSSHLIELAERYQRMDIKAYILSRTLIAPYLS